jgi:Tol biopolymer transport system component
MVMRRFALFLLACIAWAAVARLRSDRAPWRDRRRPWWRDLPQRLSRHARDELTRRRLAFITSAVLAGALCVGANAQSSARAPGAESSLSWAPDGKAVAFQLRRRSQGDVYFTSLTGAEKQLTSGPADDYDPAWSPSGRTIAYARTLYDNPSVWVVGRTGTGAHRLARNGEAPLWSPKGDLVAFVADQTLAGGSRMSVIDAHGRHRRALSKVLDFAWSPSGTALVYNFGFGPTHIGVIGVDGSDRHLLTKVQDEDQAPIFSPNGEQIAFSRLRDQNDSAAIYVISADGKNERRLTSGSKLFWDASPAWSPDGTQVGFIRGPSSAALIPNYQELWVVNSDGKSAHRLVSDARGFAWSPDGKQIAFANSRDRLWVMNSDGMEKHPLTGR